MAIQAQKYTGKNPYNNQVIVDYTKRTVRFKPVTAGKSIKYCYLCFLFNHLELLILFNLLPIILLTIWFEFMYVQEWLAPTFYFVCLLLVCVVAIIWSWKFWDEKWRNTVFPEYNYDMVRFLRKMFFSKNKTKAKFVTGESIRHNELLLPHFENIMLKYETVGDFSEFLKKVVIKNIYHDNPYEWWCVFKFTKKPKKGYMMVEYL